MRYGCAYAIHYPRNIAAPDHGEADVTHGTQQPFAQLPVHWVDAGGAYTHQYPVRTKLGHWDVSDLQNLRAAISLTDCSAHKNKHSAISTRPLAGTTDGRVDFSRLHWEVGPLGGQAIGSFSEIRKRSEGSLLPGRGRQAADCNTRMT